MYLCQRKKSFINIPALMLYLKLETSIFHRFVILKWRYGWVRLELSIILTQIGKIQCLSDPLHCYTNIVKAEIFHV